MLKILGDCFAIFSSCGSRGVVVMVSHKLARRRTSRTREVRLGIVWPVKSFGRIGTNAGRRVHTLMCLSQGDASDFLAIS